MTEQPEIGGLALRMALFYASVFLVVGLLLPYWPLWLSSQGLTPTEIGILLSASQWVKILSNPMTAQVADRMGERRRPMIGLAVVSLTAFLLFFVVDGFWPLLLVTVFSHASFAALMPLGETLTMQAAGMKRLDYGRVRLWGSLTFIVAATLGGRVIAEQGADWVLILVLGAMVLIVVACLPLPDLRTPPTPKRFRGSWRLLADPVFLLFLIGGGLIQASHSVYYGFGTLHWLDAGFGSGIVGWLWAEGVIAEIVLFATAAPLVRRLGPVPLLILGGALAVVRWTVTALTTDLAALVAVQALHAFSFGASHLAAIHFIARAAPPGLSATAQGLYASVAIGLMFGLAMLISGPLYGRFGGLAFLAMTVMALAGTGAAALLARRWSGDSLPV